MAGIGSQLHFHFILIRSMLSWNKLLLSLIFYITIVKMTVLNINKTLKETICNYKYLQSKDIQNIWKKLFNKNI